MISIMAVRRAMLPEPTLRPTSSALERTIDEVISTQTLAIAVTSSNPGESSDASVYNSIDTTYAKPEAIDSRPSTTVVSTDTSSTIVLGLVLLLLVLILVILVLDLIPMILRLPICPMTT